MTVKQIIGRLVVVAGAAVGGLAVHRRQSHHRVGASDARRRLAVTVNRAPQDVTPDGKLPEPLARLGDVVEVQVRPAPGDKGTELYARLRQIPPSGSTSALARMKGEDPHQQVRKALREAKTLLEVGEIVRPDAPSTTHPGLGGKLVQAATRVAQGEGRL